MSNVTHIDAKQLKAWLETGEAVLVDVREPHEFTEWRIPQAISMPLTNIDKHLPNLEGESRKIVFQCLKGKRGEMGAEAAIQALGEEVAIYNLTGGIEAWNGEGFTITRDGVAPEAGTTSIPIERQVQIMAGGLVLLFSLFALAGIKFGAIISLLIGAGLLFAGLTGSCMAAAILKKTPWNKK